MPWFLIFFQTSTHRLLPLNSYKVKLLQSPTYNNRYCLVTILLSNATNWKESKVEPTNGESSIGWNQTRTPFQDIQNNMWHMILRVNVYKFDGSNPIGWVTLMEHYFLQGVTNEMMKHQMSVLYFDMEQP